MDTELHVVIYLKKNLEVANEEHFKHVKYQSNYFVFGFKYFKILKYKILIF
jgi:hypothetical protein